MSFHLTTDWREWGIGVSVYIGQSGHGYVDVAFGPWSLFASWGAK